MQFRTRSSPASPERPSDSTDARARVAHHLSAARETAKQLHTRALLLILPLLISTIAITSAAQPHLKQIDAAGRELTALLEAKKSAREQVFKAQEAIREMKPEVEKKAAEPIVVDSDIAELVEFANLRAREKSLAESSQRVDRATKSIISAIRLATVDISFPGLDKMKLPLFFASDILQVAILATLAYLWHLRQSALARVDAAVRECDCKLLQSQRDLAMPASLLLYPLPGRAWQGHVPYGSGEAQRWQHLPVMFLLALLCGMSLWLTFLPARISGFAGENDVVAQLPLLISTLLVAATIGVALNWLIRDQQSGVADRPDPRLRRMVTFASLSMLAAVPLALIGQPKMFRTLVTAARERTRVSLLSRPRPRKKMTLLRIALAKPKRKVAPLQTRLVDDGFLFNPASGKCHVVVNGSVISVGSSERNMAAFAKYHPLDIEMKVVREPAGRESGAASPVQLARADTGNIANGHAPIAIERYFLALLEHQSAEALDFLYAAITSRLPAYRPSKASGLDLRLMDLYAKSCLVYGDSARLEAFASRLRQASLQYVLADRLDRWLDPKAKWRKRVLDYGRCSKQRYPVEGRCGFESRPTVPFRNGLQWFEPGGSEGVVATPLS